MMSRVSLKSQRYAIQLVIDGRTNFGQRAAQDLHKEQLRAAAATLAWLERHEVTIREAIATRNGGRT